MRQPISNLMTHHVITFIMNLSFDLSSSLSQFSHLVIPGDRLDDESSERILEHVTF